MSTLPKYGNLILIANPTEVAAQINPKIDTVYTNYHFINCNYKNGRLFKGRKYAVYGLYQQ